MKYKINQKPKTYFHWGFVFGGRGHIWYTIRSGPWYFRSVGRYKRLFFRVK